MADKNKPVPGSTKVKRNGKWVSITDAEKEKLDKKAAEAAKDPNASYRATPKKEPVSILKGVNRRDEIGKPSSPMVLKKPSTPSSPAKSETKSATSTPSRASVISKPSGGKSSGSGVTKKPSSMSKPKPSPKNDTPKRADYTGLKASTVGVKSSASSPMGKGEVKQVSFGSKPSSKSYSANKVKRMEKRATRKDVRKAIRTIRKKGK